MTLLRHLSLPNRPAITQHILVKRLNFGTFFIYFVIGTHKEKHIISDPPSMKTLSITEKLPHQQHSTIPSSTTKHSSTISDHKSTTGDSGISSDELGKWHHVMWSILWFSIRDEAERKGTHQVTVYIIYHIVLLSVESHEMQLAKQTAND